MGTRASSVVTCPAEPARRTRATPSPPAPSRPAASKRSADTCAVGPRCLSGPLGLVNPSGGRQSFGSSSRMEPSYEHGGLRYGDDAVYGPAQRFSPARSGRRRDKRVAHRAPAPLFAAPQEGRVPATRSLGFRSAVNSSRGGKQLERPGIAGLLRHGCLVALRDRATSRVSMSCRAAVSVSIWSASVTVPSSRRVQVSRNRCRFSAAFGVG